MKKLLLILFVGLLINIKANAQPNGPNAPVPLDSISLLFIAGAYLGAKKKYNSTKN